jgi:hypothetical protein
MSDSEERGQPDTAPSAKSDGVLRVTTGTLKLPEGLETERKANDQAINRVVLLIAGGALVFIAIITLLIYLGQ